MLDTLAGIAQIIYAAIKVVEFLPKAYQELNKMYQKWHNRPVRTFLSDSVRGRWNIWWIKHIPKCLRRSALKDRARRLELHGKVKKYG